MADNDGVNSTGEEMASADNIKDFKEQIYSLQLASQMVIDSQKKQVLLGQKLEDEVGILREEVKFFLKNHGTSGSTPMPTDRDDGKSSGGGAYIDINVKLQNLEKRVSKLDELPKLQMTMEKLKANQVKTEKELLNLQDRASKNILELQEKTREIRRDQNELDRFKDKITETLFVNGLVQRIKENETHLIKHAASLDKAVNDDEFRRYDIKVQKKF